MIRLIIITNLILLLSAPGEVNAYDTNHVVSFTTAKNKLYKQIYNNAGETFYCGCDWSNRKTNLQSCGLQSFFSKKERKRSLRTEAEHIIAASWLLKVNYKLRKCAIDSKKTKESAREYCQKHDIDYKRAHNDLVNLFPAVGAINQNRSNKPFVERVTNKVKTYGKCNIEIGSRGIKPPTDKKGDIARVAFYMATTYQVTYSKRQLELFKKWDKEDPLSLEEIKHNNRVIAVQGYGQKF
ncbi:MULTISPECIES: endonuclease [unclassified Pseudoalteromonas]|uniref:endonuclease n=1 Tax=unclassified Pseudoalteromonas TaxID=194690 RepID=UPI000421ECFD|nr:MULTISPECIES: endonuclease [unclassified Pseudoalteromonas]